MLWEILDTLYRLILVTFAICLVLVVVVLVLCACNLSYLNKHPSSRGKQRSQNKTGTRKRKSGATAKLFASSRRKEVTRPKSTMPKVPEDSWHSGNKEIEVPEKSRNWPSSSHTEQRPIPRPNVYRSELSKKDRPKKQSAQVHAVRSQDVSSKPIPQKARIAKVQPVEHTPALKMKASLKDPIAAPCLVESTLPNHDQQVAPQCSSGSLTKSACNHSEEKRKPHIKQSRQTQTGSSPVKKSKSPVSLKASSTGPHESSSSLTKSACNHSEEKKKPHIKQSQQMQTESSPATKSKQPVPSKANSTGPHESSIQFLHAEQDFTRKKGMPIFYYHCKHIAIFFL